MRASIFGALILALLLSATSLVAGEGTASTNNVRLNFHGASFDEVLDYLSDAAGFVIVNEAKPSGKLDLWAAQPVTKDEALDLLNQALLRNGYAALRKGRVLTILPRDQAKTRGLPVVLGGDPEKIPQTTELITQVIPVKYVEAAKMMLVLQPLASSHSTMTANESANTIVITDLQENIRRMVQIIQGIDNGAEDFTVVKVFHLRNANSAEMAEVIAGLFPDQTTTQQGQGGGLPFAGLPGGAPNGFGGGPGGFGGGPGGFGGATGGTGFGGGGGRGGFAGGGGAGGSAAAVSSGDQARRLANRTKVTAVADQRTQSLVVTGSRDVMPQVEAVVTQLDSDAKGKQSIAVFDLKNASPQALTKVLQEAFQKNATSSRNGSTTSQTDPLENRSTTQNQQNAANSAATGGAGRAGGGQGGGFGGAGGAGAGGGP